MNICRAKASRQPAQDMALTAAMLRSVAEGRVSAMLRIVEPGPTVAFGKRDTFCAGFQRAAQAARLHGFEPIIRQAGGHAVAYDERSVVLELLRPEEQLSGVSGDRLSELTALIRDSLGQLGVHLELGELPGEYCPGRFSLHIAGGPKVAGIAQRVMKGASLTTAVVVVGSGRRLRAVTADVYTALQLPLDVFTVGSIDDCYGSVGVSMVADAIAKLAPSQLNSFENPL